MRFDRSTGMILIAAGFILAVVGGLFLAIQVNNQQMETGSALASAAVIFVPVAGLVGFGIYLYARASGSDQIVLNTEMLKPRELLDLLKAQAQGQMNIGEAAQTLDVSEDAVKIMMKQLATLEVLSGYANWDDGLLAIADSRHLRGLKQCVICESPIVLEGTQPATIICKACRTEYYVL